MNKLRELKVLTKAQYMEILQQVGPARITRVEEDKAPSYVKIEAEGWITSHYLKDELFDFLAADYVAKLPKPEEVKDEEETPTTKFTATLSITNGTATEELAQEVNSGETATWHVAASEGYVLPTEVTNGTIADGVVTSIEVTEDITVTVTCTQQ
jgi:hypothetical protein